MDKLRVTKLIGNSPQLETVLFSIFYPAEKGSVSSLPQHLWISKPIAATAQGYARFAHISNFFTNHVFALALWTLAGRTRIPAKVDVPLLPEGGRFPVIVFSHGMASSRTDYTQYCSELASRGYIVAAVEHRDGSCPASTVMRNDGTSKTVYTIPTSDLKKSPVLDTGIETSEMKEMQLAMRTAEMEEMIRVLQMINAGEGAGVLKNNPREEGSTLASWRGRLDMEKLVVGGHSYGATGALQTLKTGPTKSLPIHGAIILDPGKSSGPLNDDINVPTMIIHSNSWSSKHSVFFGRPHFDVVKELVEKVAIRGQAAWFFTSLGTSHPSVTDAPIIEPLLLSWTTGSTIDVKEGVYQYVKATVEFMEFLKTGKRTGLLAQRVTHPMYDEESRTEEGEKKISEDISRYWQIHVAPS
ncbi:hypothetical protein BT93_L4206 [Corymbia citriodora subsp. variegata]|uniref:1-alkyl-2-acetylglycerophosphocholine esterase n=1 Tax=Corymbia citriodora subsp. variegata TaxID=360336 RepID=A0A8T0CG87_CORYI|nr:hypothetical protein BT93_L4206 [Corymbia citriodora subsp. variegata]